MPSHYNMKQRVGPHPFAPSLIQPAGPPQLGAIPFAPSPIQPAGPPQLGNDPFAGATGYTPLTPEVRGWLERGLQSQYTPGSPEWAAKVQFDEQGAGIQASGVIPTLAEEMKASRKRIKTDTTPAGVAHRDRLASSKRARQSRLSTMGLGRFDRTGKFIDERAVMPWERGANISEQFDDLADITPESRRRMIENDPKLKAEMFRRIQTSRKEQADAAKAERRVAVASTNTRGAAIRERMLKEGTLRMNQPTTISPENVAIQEAARSRREAQYEQRHSAVVQNAQLRRAAQQSALGRPFMLPEGAGGGDGVPAWLWRTNPEQARLMAADQARNKILGRNQDFLQAQAKTESEQFTKRETRLGRAEENLAGYRRDSLTATATEGAASRIHEFDLAAAGNTSRETIATAEKAYRIAKDEREQRLALANMGQNIRAEGRAAGKSQAQIRQEVKDATAIITGNAATAGPSPAGGTSVPQQNPVGAKTSLGDAYDTLSTEGADKGGYYEWGPMSAARALGNLATVTFGGEGWSYDRNKASMAAEVMALFEKGQISDENADSIAIALKEKMDLGFISNLTPTKGSAAKKAVDRFLKSVLSGKGLNGANLTDAEKQMIINTDSVYWMPGV